MFSSSSIKAFCGKGSHAAVVLMQDFLAKIDIRTYFLICSNWCIYGQSFFGEKCIFDKSVER